MGLFVGLAKVLLAWCCCVVSYRLRCLARRRLQIQEIVTLQMPKGRRGSRPFARSVLVGVPRLGGTIRENCRRPSLRIDPGGLGG